MTWGQRFRRACRYRLVVPIKRSAHSPEHIARGVMVGLAWGLTPTIGLQMAACFLTWLVTVRLLRWDFNLVVALAWTWTTNVITMLPCYYLFYVTGQLMLGRFDDLTGYHDFLAVWRENAPGELDMSISDWFSVFGPLLLKDWGLPLAIGWLPWSALGAWAGYAWTLRFVRQYRAARHRRRMARAARAEAAAAGPEKARPGRSGAARGAMPSPSREGS